MYPQNYKKYFRMVLLLICLYGLLPLAVFAQADPASSPSISQRQVMQTPTNTSATTQRVYWSNEPTGQTTVSANGETLVQPGVNDTVDFIVVLNEQPVSAYQQQLRSMRTASQQAVESMVANYSVQLAAQQDAVLQSLQKSGLLRATKYHYTYLLNGLALSAPQGSIAQIKQAPGVKAIFPDYRAQPLLAESVPLIGAPNVWAQTTGGVNIRGQNQRIAVIDTGIDYTHPDLGGCFGPTCRVTGGYDFANNDTDPMDDIGHGTHVAGIIAANGGVKGVAPEAKLLAYKVCLASGCPYSAILAGLERAANPDNNPATQDAVDVINMSLGGPGTPDDPLSMATDQAVAQGIVVVVAAGNAGSGYRTIGSPGAAANAITVGASSKTDMMADFSSRGWVGNYVTKPDLTAPGVAINSTVLNHGYAVYNGTSMASPHVAGAAALLHQAHPIWTPAQIKASLMNNAKDIGANPFTQGAGRVRVDQALNPDVLLLPGILSFGRVDPTQAIWTKTLALQVQNPTATTQNYQLAIAPGLPAGINSALSQSQVTLAAGQAITVNLTLTVDNQVLPFQTDPSFAYNGALLITTGANQRRVPFDLVKETELAITLDPTGAAWFVWVRNQAGGVQLVDVQGQTQVVVPVLPGKYDLIATYPNAQAFVALENVQVTNSTSVTLLSSQATNLLTTNFQQFNNQIVSITQRDEHYIVHKGSHNDLFISGSGFSGGPLRFSPFSNNYYLENCTYQRNYPAEQSVYDLCYSMDGSSATQTQLIKAQSLKKLSTQLEPEINASQAFPVISYRPNPYFAMSTWNVSSDWLTLPFTRTFYFTPSTSPFATARDITAEQKAANGNALPRVWSSRLRFTNNMTTTMDLWNYNPVTKNWDNEQLSTAATDWKLAFAPVYWAGHFDNTTNQVKLEANALWGSFDDHYLFLRDHHQNTLLDRTFPYTLTTSTGTTNGVIAAQNLLSVTPGPVRLTLSYRTRFLSADNRGIVTATFNTSLPDKNPPLLSEVKITAADNVRTDTLQGAGSVAVRIQDNVGVASVAFALDYNNGQGWQQLSPSLSNGFYRATIPAWSGATSTLIALRISVTDVNGNQLNNEIRPAFLAKPMVVVTPQSDLGDAPDSTTHTKATMLAYPGVLANFPTTFANDPIPGPFHKQAKQDAWLGADVSGEKDADQQPDQDTVTNLEPQLNSSNRDRFDDGVLLNSLKLPTCGKTTFQYVVKVVGKKSTRYINSWFDFNYDGDFKDSFTCKVGSTTYTVKEWALENLALSQGPGQYTLTTPAFNAMLPPTQDKTLWMRITLSEGKAATIPGTAQADGRGPVNGYNFGETEDYLLPGPQNNPVLSAEADETVEIKELSPDSVQFEDSLAPTADPQPAAPPVQDMTTLPYHINLPLIRR
ncbi:MAG: S8 family serine peptidase [Caldilineaceae bacterium]